MAEFNGTSGDDTLIGGIENDVIRGFAGHDTLLGGDGDDYLDGGTGRDGLIGGAGIDFLAGGLDGDWLFGDDGGDTLLGEDGDDHLEGGAGRDGMIGGAGIDFLAGGLDGDWLFGGDDGDTLLGEDGDDYLEGGAGRDGLIGGAGIDFLAGGLDGDWLFGDDGGDTLLGEDGDDYLEGGAGRDGLVGGAGNDHLVGGEDDDSLFGEDGEDLIRAGNGDDYAAGGAGNDDIAGEAGNDRLEGGAGRDGLLGGAGIDHLLGGADGDWLFGGDDGDTLLGEDGDDYLDGGAGRDGLIGGAGSDTLLGGADGDWLFGEDGGDNIQGQDGDDWLEGGAGQDGLSGGAGNDQLFGGADGDWLFGDDGDDVLNGGDGADHLEGGTGSDFYAFTAALGGGNIDTIAGFSVTDDTIVLAGAAGQPFAALASGALAAGTFVIGPAAVDANDYLIYNSITGALLYDADGVGGAAAVQFAALAAGLSLAAADFLVSGPENNDPAITSGATNSIPENSDVSTIVYQAVATDADGDRITYTLTGADASLLTIDAVTGAVRLISSADFETKPTYQFNVVASDSEASVSKAITLAITDVADGAPTPIINETGFPNDGTPTAQFVNRNTFLVADNPNLPDDSLPSATIVGSISADSDKDFFSITLQAGERLILDVDGTPNTLPGLDTHLRLYNPAGIEIGDNDDLVDDDPGSNPPYGHNTDSQILFRAPTAGTYYFSIESFEGGSNGSYQIHVSIAPPATPQQLLNEDIDALVSGAEWNHTNLTYGFPVSASQVPSSFSEVSPASDFAAFTAVQQNATVQLLQLVANVSVLTFAQSTATNGAGHLLADLRFAMSVEAEVAYAYYPTNGGVNSPGGSAWFNKTDFNSPAKGNYAWMGILHETGHALGLKHGHEFPIAVSADRDSTEFTVMTYRSYPGDNLSGGYSNEQWGFPQTLMMLDIAALQRMYGANFAQNAGDTVYRWSPITGEFFVNGVGQGAPGNDDGLITPSENRIFMTLWDGNGVDTYDFSNYGSNLTIDLRPGEWTKTDDAQRANLGGGHFARGQIANALLHDGDARSLIENAIGGTGNDLITANQAANSLTGGGGADTFVWQEIAHVGVGAQADALADFQSGQDKIDLRPIDATSGSPATNDAFNFIGTGAFTNTAGELRYQVEGANVRVQGDVDGNGVADLEIVVNNIAILSSTDFFL